MGRARIELTPIGIVTQGIDSGGHGEGHSRIEFIGEIEVYEEYAEALDGIEEYSHLYIISYLDRAERRVVANVSRHGGPSRLGVFATHSPGRPNPIGLSLVELVAVEGRRLKVRSLDLYTGTPVLDIKPYDYQSIVCKPRVPRWVYEMWASRAETYKKYGWPGPFCQ